ncbi:MAG: non-ribosomal peptide synthetase, partial [Hyphomicrobiales bacterium]|nr:non-ribosomal peptide synthetase [Hyphomicrobiales bacterium]
MGIWFAQIIDPSSPEHNLAEYLEIAGWIDAPLFEAAVRKVVDSIETLRVRFEGHADGPRQIIGPPCEWTMALVDVSDTPDPRVAAERWMRADLAKPVDLLCGPFLTQALFKAGADRFFWYSRYHHIVMDGFSFALVARRVAEVYSKLVAGQAVEGETFGSLVRMLEEEEAYRHSNRLEQDRQHWIDCLAGLAETASFTKRARLPSERKRSGQQALFLRRTDFMPRPTTERLRAIGESTGASLPQIVTACAAMFLHRMTGVEDVVLDLPVTARMSPIARATPGMLANALPVRLTVRPDKTVAELAADTTRLMRQVFRHQRYNIANLRRDIGRIGAHERVLGPTVNFMPFDYDLRFGGYPATAHNLTNGPVEDLSIVVYDRSDDRDLRVDFNGNPDLYSEDELASLQQRFLHFLADVSAPERRVGSLKLLPADERRRILEDWNATQRVVPSGTLVSLFGRQVERTPAAVAVLAGEERLSYRELDAQSNRLAHHLRSLGVGP